jgi:uridylate kinase
LKDSSATRFDQLTYTDVLTKRLAVLDSTATSLCMDNEMPILVFDINKEGNISRAALGEPVGTLIHGGTNA